MASLFRPEFEAALRLLARVSEGLVVQGLPRPILVGGAAAEYYSGSAITTGDFDLCSPVHEALEAEMQSHGFVRPSGPGKLTRGWIHPEFRLGFEIVASTPMDGSVDAGRLQLVRPIGSDLVIRIIPVEDLIADRRGNMPQERRQIVLLRPRRCWH